jgi:probable F420-dependent oxidoreductase
VKVRIGVSLGVDGSSDAGMLAEAVTAMEELRFDSLWLAERLTTSIPDSIAGIGYAAAVTRRLKLGTGVVVLPGRNPAVVAKQLASLDQLSGGRLLVTFGLGGEPADRAALPIPEGRSRGDVFDETLDLVRRYLTEGGVDGVAVRPPTVQRPLEFWVAGSVPAAQRRAGRLADGWLTSLLTPDEARQGREVVEEAAERAGRGIEPEHFGVSLAYVDELHRAVPAGVGDLPAGLVATIATRRPGVDPTTLIPNGLPAAAAFLEDYIKAGFSKFVVRPATTPARWPDTLAAMAKVLLPLQS